MPRILSILLVVAGSALLALLAVVLLANATGPRTGASVTLSGLTAPVELSLDPGGGMHIDARTEQDFFAGMGYAHALRHPWMATLLKVAATGRMSQHAADSTALAIDHHIARLGIPTTARRAYFALPDSVRAYFDAYAEGVNRSFSRNRLDRSDEFIVFDVAHQNWEGWHPIATEMLIAYLATAADLMRNVDETAGSAPAAVRAFVRADSLLRSVLALDGLQYSAAFALADTAGTRVVHRIVYGQSGLPLVQPVGYTLGGAEGMITSVVGTLALWGGKTEARTWAVVPSPRARLSVTSASPPEPQYGRVVRHDGSELLVTSRRSLGRLFIDEAEFVTRAPADTLLVDENGDLEEEPEIVGPQWWALDWPGIAARGTDIASWLALLRGEEPNFEVLPAATLIVTAEGTARVAGQPVFSAALPGGTFISGSEDASEVAERLAATGTAPLTPEPGTDTFSTWASQLAPPLVGVLGHPDSVAMNIRDAVAFLQGWDFRYDGEDIAASIFEAWMDVYERITGHLPTPDTLQLEPVERADTLRVRFADLVAEEVAEARQEGRRPPPIADTLAANPEMADSLVAVARTRMEDPHDLRMVKRSFETSINQLREAHGRPGPAWRWQRLQTSTLRFPGRTDRPGTAPDSRRFRDAPLGDGGHPTTVLWGPSPRTGHAYTAAWVAWTSTASFDRVEFVFREPFRVPLDIRYVDPPEPTPVRFWQRGVRPEQTIRLEPPS